MNEQNRLSTLVGGLFNALPIGISFLMPIFFMATTVEFFEFNKLFLLTAATLLLLLAWTFKLIETKSLGFTKSMMDVPLWLFTLSVVLSTIFSLNKTVSIYGSQGRWFPSLFGTLVLVTWYYMVSGNIKKRDAIKSSLMAMVFGISISSLVALLSYYGIAIGSASYFRTGSFSLTGSFTSATVLAALATILSLGMLMYENGMQKKAMLLVATVINYFLVLLVSILPAWVVLGVGLLGIVFFVSYKKIMENTTFLAIAVGSLALVTLVVIVPTTRDAIVNAGFTTEILLPVRESWIVASETVQDYPTLATGPSSFSLNFPRYRPLSLNNGTLWNLRFDKPYNEAFNILATLGIVGLLTAAYLVQKSLKLFSIGLKTHEDDGLSKVLAISAAALLTVFMFTYATVVTSYFIVTLVALLVANLGMLKTSPDVARNVTVKLSSIAPVTTIGEEGAIKKEYIHFIFALPLLAMIGYAGYLASRVYAAEVYLRSSLVAAQRNDGAGTFRFQTSAINTNPQRDAYHTAYAQTNLALANSLASKEELTDQERQTIQQLIAQAIRSSRVSTEVVSPLNVENWITRAGVYRAISPIAQNASDWAIASYNTAIQLSPTDPRLRLELGGIYYARGDYLTAANFYRQAILLKQDYANAHFNFAQALVQLQDYANARRAFEVTRSLLSADSNDYQLVEEALANLPQPQQPGENLATVEEIENSTEGNAQQQPAQQAPAQEPLTTVGEEEVVEAENLQPGVLPNDGNNQPQEGEQQEQPQQ